MFWLFASLVVLIAPPLRAGTYVISSQTGGTLSQVPDPRPPQVIAENPNTTYGPYNGGYGGSANAGGANATATASGPITTTFNWSPAYTGEPAPTQAVVTETSSVSASSSQGGSSASTSGGCADGFGDTPSGGTTPSYNPDGSLSASNTSYTSAGTRYTVVTSGSSFTVNCSPSATASTGGGPAGAQVTYSATAIPIVVDLTGVTIDSTGKNNILIGQQCVAGLGIGSFSAQNYLWNVGGYTFASFIVASDQSSGHVAYVPSITWTTATPGWCWRKDQITSVSCTADVYAGATFVGTVTASVTVNVQAPSYSLALTYGGVVVYAAGGNNYAIHATGDGTKLGGGGSNWLGPVTTPFLYTAGGTQSGQWNYLQLESPGRTHYYSSATVACSYNGLPGLDGPWPYAAPEEDPFNATNGWAADGTSHVDRDIPGTALQDAVLGVATGVSINESFEVYMMYLPPGSTSSWVPLDNESWCWKSSAQIPAPSDDWDDFANPAGTVGDGTGPPGRRTSFQTGSGS